MHDSNNKPNGALILCFSLLTLSLEICSAKLIQSAEIVSGSYFTDLWHYFSQWYLAIPIFITVCVLFYGLFLLIKK